MEKKLKMSNKAIEHIIFDGGQHISLPCASL